MSHYPEQPGWKDPTTSKMAAKSLTAGPMKTRHKTLRERVLTLYDSGFKGTADDAGKMLGISPFSCRPRVTELYKLEKLERVRIASQDGSHRWIMQARRKPHPPQPVKATMKEVADQLNLLLDDDGQPDEQQEWRDYDPDC